jgi:hypothetical protein
LDNYTAAETPAIPPPITIVSNFRPFCKGILELIGGA